MENTNSKTDTHYTQKEIEKLQRKNNFIKNHHKVSLILFFSIFIGILSSIFLFNRWGISISLLISLTIIGFISVNGIQNKSYFGYFLIFSSFLLSLTFGIFNNDLTSILNIVFIWLSLMGGLLCITYKDVEKFPSIFFAALFSRIFGNNFISIFILPKFIKSIFRTKNISLGRNHSTNLKNIFKGLLISIPFLFVLIVILSQADDVFKYYLSNFNFNFNFNFDFSKIPNIIMFIFVFSYIFGSYSSFTTSLSISKNDRNYWKFNIFTLATVLIMIIILYLTFTIVQVSYLYAKGTLPDGITYSNYARNGFFNLIYVVIINIVLVVTLKNKTIYNSNTAKNFFNILYSIITLLTMNMSIAAFYKMTIYIQAYGYTFLRVLVISFIIFLVITMMYILIYIWSNLNIFKLVVITGLIIYLVLNFMNINNFIATKNIENPSIVGTDQAYLPSLSVDANKAMLKGFKDGKIKKETFDNWISYNSYAKESDHSAPFYCYNYNVKKFENFKK